MDVVVELTEEDSRPVALSLVVVVVVEQSWETATGRPRHGFVYVKHADRKTANSPTGCRWRLMGESNHQLPRLQPPTRSPGSHRLSVCVASVKLGGVGNPP